MTVYADQPSTTIKVVSYYLVIFALSSIAMILQNYQCEFLYLKHCLRNPRARIFLQPFNARNKKTLGNRAFAVVAATFFNVLPCEIRQEDNFDHSKTLVKTFLFRVAYG